jgi:hypothetical protein
MMPGGFGTGGPTGGHEARREGGGARAGERRRAFRGDLEAARWMEGVSVRIGGQVVGGGARLGRGRRRGSSLFRIRFFVP